MPATDSPLGLNVYHWGRTQQNRLLVEAVGPLVRELREQGAIERFWFDRFDARGPHLFLLMTQGTVDADPLRRLWTERLDRFLAKKPSTEELSLEELEKRHEQTRGKALCEPDRQPGIVENNSYLFFDHPARGYPFGLSARTAFEERLWQGITEQTSWAIDRLAEEPEKLRLGLGADWMAALDRQLVARRGDAESYWRYHATTLIYGLAEHLENEPEAVIEALPRSIGERNLQALSSAWDQRAPRPWTGFEPLVDHLLGDADERSGPRWPLLREIAHGTLKQLGLPVSLHVPIVLFAWHRSLPVSQPRA